MLYPIILHKDEGSDYGVTVPDFPGVFSGGATLDEALANVQDAIECFYDGEENANPPSPSALEAVLVSEDAQGGAVVLVEVNFDFLEKSRVLADGGNTIRDVAAHMDDIRALQPDYVYLCYGLNDISIGYWDTKEEYVAELLQVVADLKEALPGVTVVVSSILPAQDPAFEKSSKWRNIPEWSEAVGAACAENGIPFADNTEICQTYADLWQPDGIHVRPEFYPYWAANLILAGLDSPAEAEDATNETENDPA